MFASLDIITGSCMCANLQSLERHRISAIMNQRLDILSTNLMRFYVYLDDLVLEIKVGCPPGLTLAFDPDGTEALSNQSDIFQCIISHSPKIPCITVAGKKR